jgi:penicillin-binding protein 1C
MLYSALARLGEAWPLKTRMDEPASAQPIRARLFEPFAAWYVAPALLGTPPPEHAAGGRIAFKTGTAYGYRDAWAVGFDGRRTIAVWVGRPDGQPVPGLVGRSAAAPILFEAFARISPGRPAPPPPSPAGVIAGPTLKLPPPLQRFARAGAEAEAVRIVFPPNGARLALEGEPAPIAVKATGGVAPFTLLVDGLPAATSPVLRSLLWRPRGAGFARITVIDARGASDSVTVRLQ